MILGLWITLLCLSFVIIIVGQVIAADSLRLGGFALLFLTSLVMLFGSIEYTHGYTETVSGVVTTVTPIEVTITESSTFFGTITYHTFAFILAIIAIFGFVNVLTDRNQEN